MSIFLNFVIHYSRFALIILINALRIPCSIIIFGKLKIMWVFLVLLIIKEMCEGDIIKYECCCYSNVIGRIGNK